MKKLNSTKIAFALFAVMTATSVTGAIGSTLAWYAYSTRAILSYRGTSVNEVSFLQIGICSDEPIGMPAGTASLDTDLLAATGNYYYFADAGKGLKYDAISAYLTKKGFAVNELEPTTSGSYSKGNDQSIFKLKQAPNELTPGNTVTAEKHTYLKIPLVFRVQGESADVFHDDSELWLSKAVAKAYTAEDGEIYKALRIFVDRDDDIYGVWNEVLDIATGENNPIGDLGKSYYLNTTSHELFKYVSDEWEVVSNADVQDEAPSASILKNYQTGDFYINTANDKVYSKQGNDFLVNPVAENRGQTRVGGVLNRTRDEYYDFDNDGEILYGEYYDSALNLKSNEGYDGEDTEDDANGAGSLTPSTFVAKHRDGVKYYSNLQNSDALFKHAEFESISSIAPARDEYDRLTNRDPLNVTSVCKTRADDYHLARVNLTIYLEGWDFAVIDKEVAHTFELGLTFEVSR